MRPLFHKNAFTWPNQKDGALLPFNKCPRTSNQDNGMSGFMTTVWGFQVSSLFLQHRSLDLCFDALRWNPCD